MEQTATDYVRTIHRRVNEATFCPSGRERNTFVRHETCWMLARLRNHHWGGTIREYVKGNKSTRKSLKSTTDRFISYNRCNSTLWKAIIVQKRFLNLKRRMKWNSSQTTTKRVVKTDLFIGAKRVAPRRLLLWEENYTSRHLLNTASRIWETDPHVPFLSGTVDRRISLRHHRKNNLFSSLACF